MYRINRQNEKVSDPLEITLRYRLPSRACTPKTLPFSTPVARRTSKQATVNFQSPEPPRSIGRITQKFSLIGSKSYTKRKWLTEKEYKWFIDFR